MHDTRRFGGTRSTRAVNLTLACVWCAREVSGILGERDMTTGRLHVRPGTNRFRIARGGPACLECGGPLMLSDWSASEAA